MKASTLLKSLPLWMVYSGWVFYAYNELSTGLAIVGFSLVWSAWICWYCIMLANEKGNKNVGTTDSSDLFEQCIKRADLLR